MAKVEEKILIEAPVEEVFIRLTDVERSPEWTPHLVSAERTSEIQAGPGLEAAVVARVGGQTSKGTTRCVDWVPPRRVVLQVSFDGGITSTTVFELASSGPKTELTARVEFKIGGGGLARLVGEALGESLARKDLRKALANLQSQLEAEQTQLPAEIAA